MHTIARQYGAVALTFLLVACQTTSFYKSETLDGTDPERRILLMPPDIELSELSAGGATVVNAAWTEDGIAHARTAMQKYFHERDAALVGYRRSAVDDDPNSPTVQLIKLHAAVGGTAMAHYLTPQFRLPHKGETFDWTLGDTVEVLRNRYDADYALFVHLRDSYTSAGRVAVIVAAALFGVSVQGGTQTGFATLVDLDTGEIVWFNVLGRASGDMREPGSAEETIQALLKDFPT